MHDKDKWTRYTAYWIIGYPSLLIFIWITHDDVRLYLKKLWEDPIAFFTLVLAISTILLWKETRKSASISERALTELERPYVYGAVSKPGFKLVPLPGVYGGRLERGLLEVCIYNFGRTPANITRLEYRVSLAKHGEIVPPIDPSAVGGRELPVGTISANGDPFAEVTNMVLQFLDEEADIIEQQQSIWVVGFVRYADIFGSHHITGFCQVLDVFAGRFVRRGDERYNYARKEDPKNIPVSSDVFPEIHHA